MKRQDALIEAAELLERLADPRLRIYDASVNFFRQDGELTEEEQYRQAHIPGAAFFDHHRFSDADNPYAYMALPPAAMVEMVGRIGIADDAEVIVYTADVLPAATRAWWLLRYAGHDNVRILNGGLQGWREAGGPLAQGGHTYAPARFSGPARPELFAGKEAVLAALQNGQVCTVNTLPDGLGMGHISGSARLACDGLMDEMRVLRSNDVLAAALAHETGYEQVITYCGGGFAATVNALAHLLAGNPNVAVYDGSLSEWAGEGLPMETG